MLVATGGASIPVTLIPSVDHPDRFSQDAADGFDNILVTCDLLFAKTRFADLAFLEPGVRVVELMTGRTGVSFPVATREPERGARHKHQHNA
jgi:hypothetical protein